MLTSPRVVFIVLAMLMPCTASSNTADIGTKTSRLKRAMREQNLSYGNPVDASKSSPDDDYLGKTAYGDLQGGRFGVFGHQQNEFGSGNNGNAQIFNHLDEERGSEAQEDQAKLPSKRFNEFLGKRTKLPVRLLGNADERSSQVSDESALRELKKELFAFLNQNAMKRQYEFVGKRNHDLLGKRYEFLGKRYDFLGKRYDFIGKRMPYEFLGKRNYDFLGKRYDFLGKRYDFLGKRAPYEFVGKRSPAMLQDANVTKNPINPQKSAGSSESNSSVVDKRYLEFLGKKKRTAEVGEAVMSDGARLAALLEDNGLRKRLSRLLLNQRLNGQYPEFIGK